MAYQIATEAYAKNIGGKNISYTSNLGCTKSRAIALGCEVSGTYKDNQLVCQKDLSAHKYIFNYNITYKYSLIHPDVARFFMISDGNGLLNTKNRINASSVDTSSCYISTSTASTDTIRFSGNKYININGTFDMISGNTYYILYVPIGVSSDITKIPPGAINNSFWKSIYRFQFNSSIYNYSGNITAQI